MDTKIGKILSFKSVSKDERSQATMVALKGRAWSWFQWLERYNPTPTWESFKLVVVRRFQPSLIQNPFELLSVKQTRTVEEFVDEFNMFVGALKEIDQELVKRVFFNSKCLWELCGSFMDENTNHSHTFPLFQL